MASHNDERISDEVATASWENKQLFTDFWRFIMLFTRRILFACTFVLTLSLTTLAQDFRGAISGHITEASGAAVANATVTVTNVATNVSQSMTTNESGDFNAPYLIPGKYRVTVESTGFKKAVRDNIEVRVGDRLQLDMALEVGAVSETVTPSL